MSIEDKITEASELYNAGDRKKALMALENATLLLRREYVLSEEIVNKTLQLTDKQRMLFSEYAEANGNPVEISSTEDEFRLKVPGLLPRTKSEKIEYATGMIDNALCTYGCSHTFPQFGKCTIFIVCTYPEGKKARWYDHDNLEIKCAKDVMANFILADDTSRFCTDIFISKTGEDFSTEFIVVRPEHTSATLEKLQKLC